MHIRVVVVLEYISNEIGCRASVTEKVGRVVSYIIATRHDLSPTCPPTRQTILTCRDGPTRPISP